MKLTTIASLCLLSVGCLHNVRAQTAAYPSAIVTDANLKVAVNGVHTLLTGALNSAATTLAVSSCSGIVPNVLITIDQEIMPVSGCTGTVLVVGSRGFDSTTAASHAASTPVYAYVDAWHHNSLRVEVEAIETALGTNLSNTGGAGSCPSNQAVTAINIGSTPTCAGVVNTFNTRGGAVTLASADVAAVEQDLRTTATPTFTGQTLTAQQNITRSVDAGYGLTVTTSGGPGGTSPGVFIAAGGGVAINATSTGSTAALIGDSHGNCTLHVLTGWDCQPGVPFIYVGTETGSNNAIVGTAPSAASLTVNSVVQVLLAHTLQAGANTFNYASGGAIAIKSCRNPANNIATGYAVGGVITLINNTTFSVWCDSSQ